MKNVLWILLAGMIFSCSESKTEENQEVMPDMKKVYIGTYTNKESKGIYTFNFDLNTGDASLLSVTEGIESPSFLCLSPDGKNLYAVSELENGGVQAYAVGDSSLTFINAASSAGVHPCHISCSANGQWLYVGNYSSGSLSVLKRNPDGSISEPIQEIKHKGSSVNKSRQEAPHVHSITPSPDGKFVFVADLGIDKIVAYSQNDSTGMLTEAYEVAVTPGSGPRHFTFDPAGTHAYLVQELTGSVTVYDYASDGQLIFKQEISTLPDGFEGDNSSADIHISPDGKFLYASNRFHDSIVVYKIAEDGTLSLVSHHTVVGKVPRNFAIDGSGKYVLVANQDTDNIVVFVRDAETGKISPTGKEFKVSMPVCVLFER